MRESVLKKFLLCAAAALILLMLPPHKAQAQLLGGPTHISFQTALLPADARAGEGAEVTLTAKIDPGYHLYSLTQPAGGSQGMTITLAPGGPFAAVGRPVQPLYRSVFNTAFKITDQLYENQVTFGIPVTLKPGLTGEQKASVSVHYQICNDQHCLIPTTVIIPIAFTPAPGAARAAHLAMLTSVPPQAVAQAPSQTVQAGTTAAPVGDDAAGQSVKAAEKGGLLDFLGLAIGAGFLALLTPCVFPMIPITVSFFAKRKRDNPRQGVLAAVAYCLGIIFTFTVLGVAAAALFKATGIRVFATNPVVNLLLAALFTVLAVNLMGGFEIAVPSGLANKFGNSSRKAGLIGPFFMGLTFTLTSFTCTVAFVGTLLAAASQGNLFYPIVGMLGFSSAFALPFFLLALFPQYLANLPRSGAWLATVKAFMGFIELAAALKFLSNADLAWSLGWLTRPVFLSIWAGLAAVAGVTMLGWLRLSHDYENNIGWPRRIVGLASLGASVLLLAGMNGVHLGKLADFLPPDPYPGHVSSSADGLVWHHNYKTALAEAQAENKNLLVNFTGVNCTNCRDMEQNVFPLPEVSGELKKFALAELFTDRPRADDEANALLMQKLTGVATLPVYVVVSPQGKVLELLQDRNSPDKFTAFLKKADMVR